MVTMIMSLDCMTGYQKLVERANLNRPRTQSVPRSRLQDPDYQCKRDLGWNIDYATTFLVDHLEKADSHNSRMATDILS